MVIGKYISCKNRRVIKKIIEIRLFFFTLLPGRMWMMKLLLQEKYRSVPQVIMTIDATYSLACSSANEIGCCNNSPTL